MALSSRLQERPLLELLERQIGYRDGEMFFPAEDGRSLHCGTAVQTCAPPSRYRRGGPSAKRAISANWASSSVGKATDWRVGSAMALSSRLQERPLLELLERLPELLLGVHHDGAVPRHGLFQRLPRNQKEPDPLLPGLHRDLVTLVEEHQRAVVHL